MVLHVSAATDVGLKRPHNEDSHAWWVPTEPAEARRGAILVVADGMGGAVAGEVASRLAVDCVMRRHREGCELDPMECLRRSIETANKAIHDQGQAYPEMRGMGTTCTAVVARDGELCFGHVGDSRAYRLRDGLIEQITEDHSLVAQLVLHHHITPEQAKVDPRRNVVTRSVGVSPEVDVDARQLDEPLQPGDTIVLCTDGLHGLVDNDEIARLATGADLERACTELIALANARGGSDNITVVLGRLEA